MRNRLFWIVTGGLSFWLPTIVLYIALHENLGPWARNVVPLAGVALLGVATWVRTKHWPHWGWVLAGIYILGPVSMMAPPVFLHSPTGPSVPGEWMWTLFFILFPPMTLWMSLLSAMLFSVLIVTVILPILAAYPKDRNLRPGAGVIAEDQAS